MLVQKKIYSKILSFVFFCILSNNLFCQEPLQFMKDFICGDINTKTEVLELVQNFEEKIVINEAAFDFIDSYFNLLKDEQSFKNLVYVAVKNIDSTTSSKNIGVVKKLFTNFEDENIKIAIIEGLPSLNGNISEILSIINNYVDSSIKSKNIDSPLFRSSVLCLAKCLHPSSFPVLFSCLSNGVTKLIDQDVESALIKMSSSNRSQIVAIIANNPPKEKLLALQICEKNLQNPDFFTEEIAENALAIAISISGDLQDIPGDLVTLQLEAMRVISKSSWTRAASLMVRYFELAKKQYSCGIISKANFIEVIQCLSNLPTTESGECLSSYLAALNIETEKTGSYDKDIMLAVINSLGVLGEKSAFDYLLYVISFSTYSEEIISASRDALSRLKW